MKSRAAKFLLEISIISLLISGTVRAQAGGGATISGTVTNPSGAAVPNARVSAKNLATGQSIETQTDASGVYTVPNLGPGDYEVSVSADGLGGQTSKVTLAAEAKQTVNLALTAPGNPDAPSLGDLGFPVDQTKGSAQDQARLDKRSHMLKIHQRFGLITLAPLVATIVTSSMAGGKHSTAIDRDVHGALGSVTADMYFMAAYYAIRAPRIPGTTTRGPIRLHKALAWIHGPGMILTPILGAMALSQEDKGEKDHGLAKEHGTVAAVTYTAFGLAVLSVSIKF
jgi:hypothetical protein